MTAAPLRMSESITDGRSGDPYDKEPSLWDSVPEAPPDPIFDLLQRCKADTNPEKMDLSVGAYRDEDGLPYLLPVVKRVESLLVDAALDKEYLPIDGLKPFRDASVRLLLGDDSPAIAEDRVASCQTLSGTGALRVAAEFYSSWCPQKTATTVLLSDPTWVNHRNIFKKAGFETILQYRYFDATTCGVDFEAMKTDLASAPKGSIVVLQLCAHNPTGADPTHAQWEELVGVLSEMGHYILFDNAYQGYASGDPDEDAFAARLFEDEGLEFATAQSYSKNFGLYSERIGCLSFVCGSSSVATAISSQLKAIIRPMYSNPPAHGARIVMRILTDPELYVEWRNQMNNMSLRIKTMRAMLCEKLTSLNATPPAACADWSHIVKQIGMFSYLGLTPEQCDLIVSKFHIYLTRSGRISVAGLSSKTVHRLAMAINVACAPPSESAVRRSSSSGSQRSRRRAPSRGNSGDEAE